MGQLKRLAGQTVIYGASSILGRVLNYLLVPFYTSVFSYGEYGVVTELYAFIAFLNVMYAYGFETTYFRFATKSKDSIRYFRLAETSLIITSSLFSGFIILTAEPIASLLDYPGKGHYISWLALVLFIDAIVAVPFAKLRLGDRAVTFAVLKLSNIFLNISLNLFFLVFCPWWLSSHDSSLISAIYLPELGVGYVFLSNLIANSIYLIYFLPSIIKQKPLFEKEWRAMLLYAVPLLIVGLAGATNEMLSRILLKYLLPENFYEGYTNQEILGIFGACYKLSVFMILAVQAFRYAFEPFFFSEAESKNSPRLFAQAMHAFIIFGSFSWMFISFFLPEIGPVFLRKPGYLTGLDIVPWLLGGALFLGIYFNLSLWYKLSEKTIYGAWISVMGAVITIVLNVALIPVIGYMGSAITTFISYITMVIVSYVLGQKHYKIPYHTRKGLFYLIIAGVSILGFYFWQLDQVYKYLAAIGLLVVYVIIVWFLDVRSGTFSQKR